MTPRTAWPHAPLHQLSVRGTYFVTAGTYLKHNHFRGPERLRVLHRGLLTVARDFGWHLEAWAAFFKSLCAGYKFLAPLLDSTFTRSYVCLWIAETRPRTLP